MPEDTRPDGNFLVIHAVKGEGLDDGSHVRFDQRSLDVLLLKRSGRWRYVSRVGEP
jgi:hypothetical protein